MIPTEAGALPKAHLHRRAFCLLSPLPLLCRASVQRAPSPLQHPSPPGAPESIQQDQPEPSPGSSGVHCGKLFASNSLSDPNTLERSQSPLPSPALSGFVDGQICKLLIPLGLFPTDYKYLTLSTLQPKVPRHIRIQALSWAGASLDYAMPKPREVMDVDKSLWPS